MARHKDAPLQSLNSLWSILNTPDKDMGASQSRDIGANVTAVQNEESFDLNDIPDDREDFIPETELRPSFSSGFRAINQQETPKRKKRSRKKQKPSEPIYRVNFTTEDVEEVRRKEPETFDEYAMSEDSGFLQTESSNQSGPKQVEEFLKPGQPDAETLEEELGISHQSEPSIETSTNGVNLSAIRLLPGSDREDDDMRQNLDGNTESTKHVMDSHDLHKKINSTELPENGNVGHSQQELNQPFDELPETPWAEEPESEPVQKQGLKRKHGSSESPTSSAQSGVKKRKRSRSNSITESSTGSVNGYQDSAQDETPVPILDKSSLRINHVGNSSRSPSGSGNNTRFEGEQVELQPSNSNLRSPTKSVQQNVQAISPVPFDSSSSSEENDLPLMIENRRSPQPDYRGGTPAGQSLSNSLAKDAPTSTRSGKKKTATSRGTGPASTGSKTPKKPQESEKDNANAYGMATSIARKGLSAMTKRSKGGKRSVERNTTAESSSHNSDHEDILSDKESGLQPNQVLEGPEHQAVSKSSKKKKKRREPEKQTKQIKASIGVFECEACEEEFATARALARHEDEANHGSRNGEDRSGRFSDSETRKLIYWRDRFCETHGINEPEFNDMMTASLRRGKWIYGFMEKSDFMEEYYDVLPGRSRRSMRRYRERFFQNVDKSFEWSAEDDADLARLYKELGAKWVKIGEQLTRSSDVVRQRWKMKHQLTDQRETGDWSQDERQLFKKIVEDLRRDSTPNSDASAEPRIPWTEVSKRLKTRTPRQCSNHWRALHYQKVGGRWIKPERISTPLPEVMTQEPSTRSGIPEQSSQTKRGALSREYIHDSDEDVNGNEGGEGLSDGGGSTQLPHLRPFPEYSAQIEQDDDQASLRPTKSQPFKPNFTDATPSRGLTISQAFSQTQANTSALRPGHDANISPSQQRPSPNLSIRHRRFSSPILGNSDSEIQSFADAMESQSRNLSREQSVSSSETSDTSVESNKKRSRNESRQSNPLPPSSSPSSSSSSSDESESIHYEPDSMIKATRADFVKEFSKSAGDMRQAAQKEKRRLGHKHRDFVYEGDSE